MKEVTFEFNQSIELIPMNKKSDLPIWKGPFEGDGLSGEKEVDLRSAKLKKIKLADLVFKTNQSHVSGYERLRQLKNQKNFIRLDANAGYNLWKDYDENKSRSILEWIYFHHMVIYMDFMGTIFRSSSGYPEVLCLSREEGSWKQFNNWFDNNWFSPNYSVGYRI